METWKEKYNKKYNHPKGASNSLTSISKDTGVSKKGLQQIYNKGIGAYKTNPQSVRPNVKSKEQWAMARVYSAVMGGKASKVDAKELKMEKGGKLDDKKFNIEFYRLQEDSDNETYSFTEIYKSESEAIQEAKSLSTIFEGENSVVILKSYIINDISKKDLINELQYELDEIDDYELDDLLDDYLELIADTDIGEYFNDSQVIVNFSDYDNQQEDEQRQLSEADSEKRNLINDFEERFKDFIHYSESAGYNRVSYYAILLLDSKNNLVKNDEKLFGVERYEYEKQDFVGNELINLGSRIQREKTNFNPENAVIEIRISDHQQKYKNTINDASLSIVFKPEYELSNPNSQKGYERKENTYDTGSIGFDIKTEYVVGVNSESDNDSEINEFMIRDWLESLEYDELIENRKYEYFQKGGLNADDEGIKTLISLQKPYTKGGNFHEDIAKENILKIFNNVSFRKFGNEFRKHIMSGFSQEYNIDRLTANYRWSELASYIIGDGSYYVTEDEYNNFIKNFHTTFDSSNDDIRFEKGGLIAPNGNKSNLTPRQYELVRKPAFKDWFGDWENDPENASKVVDENGEPLVVYHGTYVEKPFYIFDFNKADIGFHFGTYKQAKNRLETKLFFKDYKSNISSFFLNIKSIYQVTDIGDWEYPQRYLDMFMSDNIISEIEFKKNGFQFLNYKEDNKKIRDFLIKKYNDTIGFEYNNKYEGKGKSYIVVHSNQIKLADGTNTTFDKKSDDFRFEEGGETKKVFYENYYKNLSPSKFKVMKKGDVIEIDMMPNGAVDLTEEKEAIMGDFFKKGGEINFNPDGAIKDKIVHTSGEVGGMLVGKRHSEGGIKAINKSTGQPLEMEGGEVVITRNAVTDAQKRMFNGKYMTNREILSEINVSGGGVAFANGGQVPNTISFSDSSNFMFGGNTMSASDIAKRLSNGGNYDFAYNKGGVLSEADFPVTMSDATFVKDLGGSTNAKLYEYKNKIFVAKQGASRSHIKEELNALYLYSRFNVDVPFFLLIDGDTLAKEYIDDVRNVNWNNKYDAKKILNNYVLDALFANWDIYKNDNILIQKKTGLPFRIDNGGALRYRAKGDLKSDFDGEVKEVKSLADNNPQIKKYITPSMIKNQIDNIVNNKEAFLYIFSYPSAVDMKDIFSKRLNYLKDNKEELASYFEPSKDAIVNKTTTQQNQKISIDDIKEKVIFNTDKGFSGKMLSLDSQIGKDIFDEYIKLNNEFETLEELLPLFQNSKDSQNRAVLLSEMNRLRKKIDYDLDVEINEMQALPKDLFTTEGLLNYYYKQTSQSPVNSNLKPCNLPTPNGKKSKLPISAYLNVRTKQFKDWFGDWEKAVETGNFLNCSMIIDEETLEPQIYFHGVRRFQGMRGASAMGAGVNRPFGDFKPTNFSASYFADNKEYADFFAGTSENLPSRERREGFVYAVFLNIRRPIDLRPLGFKSSYRDILDYIAVKYGVLSEPSQAIFDILLIETEDEVKPIWTFIRNDEVLLQTLQDYGYDALFQIGDIPTFDEDGNLQDRNNWKKDNEYLTFRPNQVKSVNVKKSLYLSIFDDIRFKKGGYVSI